MKLTTPISAHGKELTDLELREPEGKEIIAIGLPFLIISNGDDDGGIEVRMKVVAKYISILGAIPPSSVESLSPVDLTAFMGVVLGFFGKEVAS